MSKRNKTKPVAYELPDLDPAQLPAPAEWLPWYPHADNYLGSPCEMDIHRPRETRYIAFGQDARRTGITAPGFPCHPVYQLYEAEGKPLPGYYVYQAGRFYEVRAWESAHIAAFGPDHHLQEVAA